MIHWEHLKSCRCQLWIWRTIFLAEGIWKVHIFRHLFVCFQTRVSPVKRHLRPSNPQLTSPTLQIQYCYSLFNQIYHMKWTKPRPGRNWLHVFCGGINKLRTKTHNIKFGLGAGKMDPDQSNLLLSILSIEKVKICPFS
jgi:hypothetical protein